VHAFELENQSVTAPEQAEGLRVAINRGRAAQGLPEVSRALWEWRLGCPGGAYLGTARDVDGGLRAAVLGIAHPASLDGQPARFMEILELHNEFDAGAGLARARALGQLAKAFSGEYGGRASDAMPVFYGWPSRRAHRFVLSQAKAEVLRSEQFLAATGDALTRLVRPAAPGLELQQVDDFPADLGGLFERFGEDRGALLVRDATRLNWRFLQHPEREYRVAMVRRGSELAGYAVYRKGEEGQSFLADWMVPAQDAEAAEALLAWAASLTLGSGQWSLVFGVSTFSPEFLAFQARGFLVADSYYTLFRSFQKPYVMSWLFHNWYYTFGDLECG